MEFKPNHNRWELLKLFKLQRLQTAVDVQDTTLKQVVSGTQKPPPLFNPAEILETLEKLNNL